MTITDDANIEECYITLFTKVSMSDAEIFMTESLGLGLGDMTTCVGLTK